MDVALLSGVVRNRKVTTRPRQPSLFSQDGSESPGNEGILRKIWGYRSVLFSSCTLRVHKFTFQWDLSLHLFVSIVSLVPFFFTGNRLYAIVPISIWAFYNVLFLIATRRANQIFPGFGRFKHDFNASVEEFFSPKLLPILSVSFVLVVLSLAVTGHELGGPPLCYRNCRACLALWTNSIPLSLEAIQSGDVPSSGCGHENGRALLGYYTMVQTSFLLYLSVIGGMAFCLAWRIAEDEMSDREDAEEWLKHEDETAFQMREKLMQIHGRPAHPVRPEGK
eukprot:gene9448-19627_t